MCDSLTSVCCTALAWTGPDSDMNTKPNTQLLDYSKLHFVQQLCDKNKIHVSSRDIATDFSSRGAWFESQLRH
jgi:hypothetical protein